MDAKQATKRFYDLIWPHRAFVLRTARILVRDVHQAEDLAQETMVKAYKAVDRFQFGTDAKKWLIAILRNTRIDRWRATEGDEQNVSLDRLLMEPADSESRETIDADNAWNNPQDVLDRFADHEIIAALQNLPEELRWTLLLVDVEGMDHREAAEILGVPVGTVKSRVHRGRGLLRQVLMPLARDRRLIKE